MVAAVNPKIRNAPYNVKLARSPGWKNVIKGLDLVFHDQPALADDDLTFYVNFGFMNGQPTSIGTHIDPPLEYARTHMNAPVNIFDIVRDASKELFINGPFHEAMFRYQSGQGWSAASLFDEQVNKWDIWRDRVKQLNDLRYNWFAEDAIPNGFERIEKIILEVLVVPEYGGYELIPLLVGWSGEDVWMMTSGFSNPFSPREEGNSTIRTTELLFRCSRSNIDSAESLKKSSEFQAITLLAEPFYWQFVDAEKARSIDLSKPLRLKTLAVYTGKAQSLAPDTPFFLSAATKEPVDLGEDLKMIPAFVTVETSIGSKLNPATAAKLYSWTGALGKAPRKFAKPSDLDLLSLLRDEISNTGNIESVTLIKRMEHYAALEFYYGRTLPPDIAPFLSNVYLVDLGQQNWAIHQRTVREWGDLDPECHNEPPSCSPALETLSAYKGLRRIDVRYSGVDSLDWLSAVSWIDTLLLSGTKIKDFSALSGAANLTSLELMQTSMPDLSPLVALNRLEELSLTESPIKDIAPLKSLTNLKQLVLSNMPIEDLRPIAALTNLEKLGLAGHDISDFSFLESNAKIRWLSFADSELEDLSLLPDLPELEELYLHNAINISDLSTLHRFPKLSVINATGTSVQDWSPVKFVKNVMGRPT